MIGKEKFRKIRREIKELQAKTHGIYCMVQHLNRVLCDMGMDSQNKKNLSPERIPMQNSRVLNELKRIATNFRNAIIEVKDSSPLESLRKFPVGACGDAALLLGHHLNDLGYEHVLRISGYKGDQSHAWVQIKGLIIDITAYQYGDIDEEVIVTNDDKWHREFNDDLQKKQADRLIK
jgi:hypothetical protein